MIGGGRLANISQPALSYQIKQLEDYLDVRLFDRHSRGVTLTPAGNALVDEAEAILARANSIKVKLQPFRAGARQPLRLGMTPTAGRAIAPELLSRMAASSLNVSVHQNFSEDLCNLVRTSGLDMAICSALEARGTDAVTLYGEDLFLVGQPELLSGHDREIAFRTVSDFRLVLDGPDHGLRRIVDALAAQEEVGLDIAMEVEAINLKREILTQQPVCSIVPLGLFINEIRRGELSALRIVEPTISRSVQLIASKFLAEEVLEEVLSFLRPIVASCIEDGMTGWYPPPQDL